MRKILITICAVIFLFSSCKKEKSYLYDVNSVVVTQPGGAKPNLKNTEEFVSIAYSDLFGIGISHTDLLKINLAYAAFGDKKLIEDMIIKNFLNDTGIVIPTSAAMRADVPAFTIASYKKFFNREPNSFETWFVGNAINADTTITPVLVYYSFMTSNEYRYY